MKILVYDPISLGISHLSFNTTIIKSIIKTSITQSIDLLLCNSQLEQYPFKKILKSDKIKEISSINNYQINNKFLYLINTIISYKNLYKLIKKSNPDVLFVLAVDNFYSPIFLMIIKKVFNINIFVILHNNIENIKNSKFKIQIWKQVFKKNIIGVVLANYVLKKAELIFNSSRNISLLNHPSYQHILNKNNEFEFDFLLLGRHSQFFYENNFSSIFFSHCQDLKGNKKIVLAIRKINSHNSENKGVVKKEYDFPMTDNEYKNMLHKSKFIIIPPQAAFRITASGVHLDAISAGVPVIAPKTGVFIENVPKSGHILLYDNESMDNCIKTAIEMNDQQYYAIKKDLVSLTSSLSVPNTSEKINKLLKTTFK